MPQLRRRSQDFPVPSLLIWLVSPSDLTGSPHTPVTPEKAVSRILFEESVRLVDVDARLLLTEATHRPCLFLAPVRIRSHLSSMSTIGGSKKESLNRCDTLRAAAV